MIAEIACHLPPSTYDLPPTKMASVRPRCASRDKWFVARAAAPTWRWRPLRLYGASRAVGVPLAAPGTFAARRPYHL